SSFFSSLLMVGRPRRSRLFPYTTLFRSRGWRGDHGRADPAYAGRDDARARGPRASGERRGGRDRAIRGTIDGKVRTMSERLEERSEEHTSELQSPYDLVCRLLLEKKNHT